MPKDDSSAARPPALQPSASPDASDESAPPLAGGDSPRDGSSEGEAYRATDPRYGLPARKDLKEENVSDILDTDEIFNRIVTNADREFGRSVQLLFWSGLAAGLTISLSFLGMASIKGVVEGPSASLISALAYPLGFIFIVLGRYQLFTENTLTPVTLVLTRRASIPRLLRIWGLVLAANVLGTAFAGFYFSQTSIMEGVTAEAATEIGKHALEMSWGSLFFKGTIAGWLVAGMVWLNHAARTATARIFIVFALMYMVSATDLAHCIVGSTEMFYLIFEGEAGVLEYLWHFLAPAALGNTVGGVFLVALLNYAQTESEMHAGREALSWREWLLGADAAEPMT